TMHGTAISLEGTLQEIEICHNRISAINEGIHVDSGVGIKIHNNKIRIYDREGAGVAIFIKAEDSVIERNDIGVVLEESIPIIVFPDGEEYLTGPCPDYDKLHDNPILFMRYAYLIWNNIIDIPQAAQFKALGGIQIAGESERIKVLENVIKGGAGNGITLGNVPSELPGPEEGETERKITVHREKNLRFTVEENGIPLKGMVLQVVNTDRTFASKDITDDNGKSNILAPKGNYISSIPGYIINEVFVEDGEESGMDICVSTAKVDVDTNDKPAFLYEIQIDRNEISNMCLSGIGIPQQSFPKIGNQVINLSIYNNHISTCLQTTDDQELRAEMTRKGVGGISLGMCEHLSIHRNRIEDNGISHIDPVCGIYVDYGEQVDITHNHISNNGPLRNPTGQLHSGIRGGIVLTVSSFDNSNSITGQDSFYFIGRHAARVHDNIVNQPAGQALRIIANGPVSILNNQFNSVLSGLNYQNISRWQKSYNFDKFAGAVLIYNSGKHFDISAPKNSADWQMPMLTLPDWQKSTIAMPAGNILFNSNQTCVGDINKSFFSQLIVSLDDIGFNGNQSDNFQNDSLLSNTLLVATTLRASESRFKEMIRSMNDQVLSLLTFAILGNITTNNQGDHCIIAESVFSIIKEPNQSLICNAEQKNIHNISNAILYFLGEVYNDQ
ncbi:MAG: right-handed parallel beta-helix repeat-containing protein, partial [Methanosarcinales archaeon]|nr:right-handed parallel beta-helix repeat-containing protein [Methanosarcinales archaeon]